MKISAFSARTTLLLTIISSGVITSALTDGSAAYARKPDKSIVNKESTSNFEQVQSDIASTLNAQAKAWNDGDLVGFMSAYSKRADTSYVSKDTQVYGYDAIEARYKRRYGDNRDSMGTLSFSDLRYVNASPSSVICIGHWLVEKKDHERLSGVFSLILVKEETGWKILHDHTS